MYQCKCFQCEEIFMDKNRRSVTCPKCRIPDLTADKKAMTNSEGLKKCPFCDFPPEVKASVKYVNDFHEVRCKYHTQWIPSSRWQLPTRCGLEEAPLREFLWNVHGHQGRYGDDGEMQCTECARFGVTDYKRQPIQDVINTAIKARAEVNLAALTAPSGKRVSVERIQEIISWEKPRHSMEIEDEERIATAIHKEIYET